MTNALAAQPPRLVSATFTETEDVLYGLPNPTGAVVAFRDDTWDFRAVEGLTPNRIRSSSVVEWESFGYPALQLAAKEVLFAQLHPDHPRVMELLAGRRHPLAIGGMQNHLGPWRAWFAWLADNDIYDLSEVGRHHWEAYLARRREDGVTPEHIAVTVGRIRDFYDYAPLLTSPTYGTRPWGRRSAIGVAGRKPRRLENATQPIPDDVFGPLVAAALHLVGHAETIIAARDTQIDQFENRLAQPVLTGSTDRSAECDRRLERLLDQHRAQRRPLPLHSKRGRRSDDPRLHDLNLSLLAFWAGTSTRALADPGRRAKLIAAVGELGVAPAPLTHSFGERHDQETAFGQVIWPGVISNALHLLVTACYIVIAISGMRLAEITAIRRGCVERVQLRNGDERIRLHGTVFKRRRHGGVPASWVVIDEVAQAVALLERLAPKDGDLLFVPPVLRSYGTATPVGRATVSIGYYLDRFCDWLAGGVLPPGLEALPAGTRVNPRQFRRTMARTLAFRPHGVIAGKVHLKHLHILISEGYYGNANSSLAAFHADMEAEFATARLEAAKERYLAYIDGGGIAGGARKALGRHFEEIASEMAGLNGTALEADKHLEGLLADRLGKLHIGTVNDCWFIDPAKALCRNGDAEPTAPRPNACVGDRCANAVVTSVHLPVYRASHEQVVTLRRSRKVSEYEKQRLASEQERLEQVIDAVEHRK